MHLTDRITLQRVAPQGDQPRCRLLNDGLDTGVTVDGADLEAAVETPGGHLLFLTDDVPFEEGLRILLLDRSLETCDSADIAMPYSTGVFRDLRILGAQSLSFRFFADEVWTLELFDTPFFRIPFFGGPLGVWRPLSFRRRFKISRR